MPEPSSGKDSCPYAVAPTGLMLWVCPVSKEVLMTHEHPVHYLVTVSRRTHVMHRQMAETREEADALAAKFESVSGTEVDITEVHHPAETDLTTHTREIVEDLHADQPSTSG